MQQSFLKIAPCNINQGDLDHHASKCIELGHVEGNAEKHLLVGALEKYKLTGDIR
jgi:hypothetical protein